MSELDVGRIQWSERACSFHLTPSYDVVSVGTPLVLQDALLMATERREVSKESILTVFRILLVVAHELSDLLPALLQTFMRSYLGEGGKAVYL